MNFQDGALFPENQQPLIITAAPYGPEWIPSDFPQDIPVTMEEQVQKAVDCYDAGATVLHLHVRELDGKGSKRLSKFNELIAGVRAAVPDMIIQVGGSISFAPETDGAAAKWLSDDTRHMLAELSPKPDQVTVTVNTVQMNILEHMELDDYAGTSLAEPAAAEAYRQPAAVMHALVVRADECEVGRAMQKRNLRRGYAVSPPSNGAHLPLVFGLRLPLLLQLMLPGPCNLNRRCSSRGCMLHELGLSPVWACTRFRRQV